MSNEHIPVALDRTIELLAPALAGKSSFLIDATLGLGGHTERLLEEFSDLQIIGIDRDKNAIEKAAVRLHRFGSRVTLVHAVYDQIKEVAADNGLQNVNGILFDLGVSSMQLDQANRGFAYSHDAPLDMRMDQSSELTASALIKRTSAEELQLIFQEYGEVSNAKTLSQLLAHHSQHATIKTIEEFKSIIAPVVKGNPNKYLAQVFQALRIAVNDEIGALKDLLRQSVDVMKPGARIVVITFHSIEDRIVKQFFKLGEVSDEEVDPVYGTKKSSPLNLISKKPIEPGEDEIRRNPRSRSAKMRVAEKKS